MGRLARASRQLRQRSKRSEQLLEASVAASVDSQSSRGGLREYMRWTCNVANGIHFCRCGDGNRPARAIKNINQTPSAFSASISTAAKSSSGGALSLVSRPPCRPPSSDYCTVRLSASALSDFRLQTRGLA